MRTKGNREMHRIFTLLVFVALAVTMLGCRDSSNNNSSSSSNTSITASQNQATPVQPTPTVNPVDAFVGTWETSDLASPDYLSLRISSATKNGGDYVGKITDLSTNNDAADYSIREKSREITLNFKPPFVSSQGSSSTYEYEFSGDGNKITLKGNKPIVLEKGSRNTEILRDVAILADLGGKYQDWAIVDANISQKIFPSVSSMILVKFEAAQKYNEGYRGKMLFMDAGSGGTVAEWTYTIPSKTKIEINDGRGTKSASYKIRGDEKQMEIDFVNASDTDLSFVRS
jgi:hypothetical protein